MALRPWNLRITDEARAGWQAFAADQGVSVHALVEALGLQLPKAGTVPASAVRRARQIDAERRRRSPGAGSS